MDTLPQTPMLPEGQPKNASYGAAISIVLILLIVIVGAFYVWGKRIDEQKALTPPTATSTDSNLIQATSTLEATTTSI